MIQVGVKAQDALILPDPATRFARTAARLDCLSAGHPMEPWLRFMARLAEAQHVVASALAPIAGPDHAAVVQAVDPRLPPLPPHRHSPDPLLGDRPAPLPHDAPPTAPPPPGPLGRA